MFKLFIILSSIILSLCEYRELPKNDYINVIPNTNVYFDISSFDDGESIDFEFEMDLFYGDYTSKTSYTFKIDQVQATSYSDSTSWTGLRQVTNRNVSCDFDDVCTFTWTEKKQAGKNYIYIIPREPYTGFYSSEHKKIKITHDGNGGLSAGAIVAIVFAVIIFIAIIVLIIVFCCCCTGDRTGCCFHCCPSCALCCCPRRYGVGTVPVPYGTGMNVVVQQPMYPPVVPAYPAPVTTVYPPVYI